MTPPLAADLAGNPATALQAPFSVVLTASQAQQYFGKSDPRAWLGRTLIYHDSITASVTGIVRDWSQNSDVQFTDPLSYSTIAHSFLRDYDANGWGPWNDDAQAFVKLAPGVTAAQAEKQFPALIVFAAMILALLLANPVISALHGFIPAGVSLNLANPHNIGFIALTVITTCLLAGWYPAWVLSAFQPVVSPRGQGTQRLNSKSHLRKGLIVFQFTISLVFIIGTIVVGRQIHYVLNTDLGFSKDAILTVDLPEDLPRNTTALLKTECSQLPGVQMTSLDGDSPESIEHGGTYLANNGNLDTKIDAGCDLMDPNYIPLYGLTLIAGRNMFPGDSSGAYIINETAAKALGFHHPADAIGRTLTCGYGGQPGPVVGVLKDFHSGSYREAIRPFFFLPARGRGLLLSVKLTAANRTARQAKHRTADGQLPGHPRRHRQPGGKSPVGITTYRQSSITKTPGRLYAGSLGRCIATPTIFPRHPLSSIAAQASSRAVFTSPDNFVKPRCAARPSHAISSRRNPGSPPRTGSTAPNLI
jgi:hypothetical protein